MGLKISVPEYLAEVEQALNEVTIGDLERKLLEQLSG